MAVEGLNVDFVEQRRRNRDTADGYAVLVLEGLKRPRIVMVVKSRMPTGGNYVQVKRA